LGGNDTFIALDDITFTPECVSGGKWLLLKMGINTVFIPKYKIIGKFRGTIFISMSTHTLKKYIHSKR
jgi:hypothetical protein